ncbi:MAG: CHAT domain-containing protein [Phaeodactylibacter sp.]|nr:CHAT domain-containing protein [Phaeodactylibacter sp.]
MNFPEDNPILKLPVYLLMCLLILLLGRERLAAQPGQEAEAAGELAAGQELLNAGQYEAVLQWVESYLGNSSENIPPPLRAALLTLEGNAQRHLGNLNRAIELHEQALGIREPYFGSRAIEVSNSLQNIGNCWLALSRPEKALPYLEKAGKIRAGILSPPHDALASANNSLAEAWRQKGEYLKAGQLLLTAIGYREMLHGARHASLAPLLLGLSNVYLDNGQPAAARQVLRRLLSRLEEAPAVQRAQAMNNMGYCQLALGEPEEALYFHEQAVALLEGSTENLAAFAGCLAGLGQCYLTLGEPSEAEPLLRRAIAFYRLYPDEYRFAIAETYNDLGLCYRSRGQLPQAASFHEEAISLYLNGGRDGHPHLAGFYDNLGKCLARQGSLQAARHYFRKAMDMLPPNGANAGARARSLLHIGNTFLEEHKPVQALSFFELSLKAYQQFTLNDLLLLQLIHYCIGNAYALSGQEGPALSHYDRAMAATGKNGAGSSFYNYEKAQILAAKGHILRKTGMADGSRKKLHEALEAYRQAVGLAKGIQPHFKNEASGLYLQGDFAGLYHGLVELCHYLSKEEEAYLSMAFHYTEDFKAAQLRRSIWRTRAKAYAGVPDSLVAREKLLKRQYYYYLKACQDEEQKGVFADPVTLSAGYARLEEVARQQDELKAFLAAKYPEYADLQQDTVVSLSGVQENLSPRQAIIEYTLADSVFFVFLITKDTFFQLRRLWPEEMAEEVKNLYYLVRTRPDVQPNRSVAAESFAESAHRLYRQLILPLAAHLREELILIPDGILCYLPFDVLLQKAGAPVHLYGRHAYLGRNHSIGYCYSATLLRLMSSRRLREVNNEVLAVAPSFEGNEIGLRPLAYNTEEARSITALWNGSNWQGKEARKSDFVEQAGQFRFLHLATHCALESGQLDDSFLAFSSGPASGSADGSLLYMPEVFGLSLQAELVTLSACQTGIGTHYSGEGLASMARAFAYAGAKCVVASLWSIDDKQTSVLMLYFYEYLAEGLPKPEALRRARLQYLEHSGHELAHPYYWAAMIAIGDPASIDDIPTRSFRDWISWKLFLAAMLVIGALAFFLQQEPIARIIKL